VPANANPIKPQRSKTSSKLFKRAVITKATPRVALHLTQPKAANKPTPNPDCAASNKAASACNAQLRMLLNYCKKSRFNQMEISYQTSATLLE
jgi:hypothetical protein